MNLQGRNLLKEADFTKFEFLYLVDLAARSAQGEATRRPSASGWSGATSPSSSRRPPPGPGRPSRSAAHDQGAHVTYLGPEESHIGHKETMKDTARVLGRMFDGIEYRGFSQEPSRCWQDSPGSRCGTG